MSGHDCPAPGCTVKGLPDEILACRPHWFALPKNLRDQIWRTWRRRSDPAEREAHRRAIVDAVTFWQAPA